MKTKAFTAAALIGLTLSIPINSPANAQTVAVAGIGYATCGAMVDQDRFYADFPEMQWMLGYITAMEVVGVTTLGGPTELKQRLDQLNDRQIVQWAQRWCSSNRSSTLRDVAGRFVQISGRI